MTSLLAAMTHDLDHPGVNQAFLIATANHLADLYQVFYYCALSSVLFASFLTCALFLEYALVFNKKKDKIYQSEIDCVNYRIPQC